MTNGRANIVEATSEELYQDALRRVLVKMEEAKKDRLEGPVTFGPITLSERRAEGVTHVHATFTVKRRYFV